MTQTAPSSPVVSSFEAGYEAGKNPKPAAPAAPTSAAGVANASGNILSQTVARAEEGAAAVGDAITHPGDTLSTVGKKAKGFFEDMDIGKIIGGIAGLAGAWFCGNFFGEGIFSTILTICLAFPLMIIGSDKIGGMVNGWMGRGKPDQEVARSPEVASPQQQPAVGQSQQQGQAQGESRVAAAPTGKTAFSEAEMNAMLDHARSAGIQTDTVTLVAQNGQVIPTIRGTADNAAEASAKVPVEQLRGVFATCKAHGYDSAITFSGVGANGHVSPSCVPLPPGATYPSRGQ